MKVLTLTTQYANNFGALLQCYALSKYVTKYEQSDCEVINYFPKDYKRSWSLFNKPRNWRDLLRQVYMLVRPDFVLGKMLRNKVMKRFIKTKLPLTAQSFRREQLLAFPPKADVYICGSDQIWNWILFKDHTYYLDFAEKYPLAKRVSYAASIADPWPTEVHNEVSCLLKHFDSVSIREEGNLALTKELLKGTTEPVVVADPVFLLSPDDWAEMMDTKYCLEEPYILCYFLSSTSLGVDTVKKIREITGYKVIGINMGARNKFNCDKIVRAIGPEDFIGLIHNASFICTNSFHASAFSIIFQKDFIFVPKSMANERIYNLQHVFGIGDVCATPERVKKMSMENVKVNYENLSTDNNSFVKFSKEYLHKAIWGAKV